MRNILTLALHDLGTAIKNKSILLILFIPCFVFLAIELVDKPKEPGAGRIALVEGAAYPPVIVHALQAAPAHFEVTQVASEEEGRRLLKEHEIDGLLMSMEAGFSEKPAEVVDHGSAAVRLPAVARPKGVAKEGQPALGVDRRPPSAVRQPAPAAPPALTLWVLKMESLQTVGLVERFAALQKATEGNPASWIAGVQAVQAGGMQRLMQPTWILMLVLLVGFIILPTQVAEEKEKQLLLGLLQTPIREVEWLIAKVILGMLLMGMSVALLHLLGQFSPANPAGYLAVLLVGGVCFSAYGVFVGMLCRDQATARTLGVVFYLPHLLPTALAEVSQQLTAIAPLLPSYQLYTSVQATLLDGRGIAARPGEGVYLLLVGCLAFYISYRLMKRRWLM